MSDDKYAWQQQCFPKWAKEGFSGIITVPPRAGKTQAGKLCIANYKKLFPYDSIWVIANSNVVLDQWRDTLEDPEIEYYTYPGAVSKLQKLVRAQKLSEIPQLMVLDECQFVSAKVWGKVLDYNVPHLLGLSATPGKSTKLIPNGVVYAVKQEDAKVADADIHFVMFDPSTKEIEKYQKQSRSIEDYQFEHPHSTYYNDEFLKLLINRRRFSTYNMKTRVSIAVDLIKQNKDRRILCMCMQTKQIEQIAKVLDTENISYCVHYTGNEHLEDYTSGKVNVCLSCKKINVGFNDVSTDVGILVSTALSEQHLTQSAYRPLTFAEGKHSDVYILLANNTSEENASKTKLYFKEKCHIEQWKDINTNKNMTE